MSYALGLPDALRRRGLVVELVPGWETRSAGSFNPKGAVCHWTAGPKASKSRPSLNICINGRAGLPGPLCNVYLDRNGVAVVVAAGRANHAGVGGWKGLVGNSAVFGTEAECGGDGDWTKAQEKAYPLVNAAYCDLGGFGPEMVCGHNEWTTRKIDIRDWPMPAMRSSVAGILAGEPSPAPPEETKENEDMEYGIYSAPGDSYAYLGAPGVWKRLEGGMGWVQTLQIIDPTVQWHTLPSVNHLEFAKNFFLDDLTGKNNFQPS